MDLGNAEDGRRLPELRAVPGRRPHLLRRRASQERPDLRDHDSRKRKWLSGSTAQNLHLAPDRFELAKRRITLREQTMAAGTQYHGAASQLCGVIHRAARIARKEPTMTGVRWQHEVRI